MSEIENNSNITKINNIGNCLKDFEILQVLGKGSFGFVAKVKSKKNLKIYAMKKNDLSMIDDDDIKKYYENEGIFMKVLDHPNICKLYTTFKENNAVYLIMEYMDSGDLFTFLDAYKKLEEPIKEEKLCIIFLQCLNSLQYIHSLGVIHRDIKPANFLYNSKGEVKLSDFNVSALQNIENAMYFTKDEEKKEELINRFTQIGSGKFQAPEINEEEDYNDKVDIYSMGVTFCTVAFFKLEIPNYQSIKDYYSREFVSIIESMMRKVPHTRPSSKVSYDRLNKYYIQKYVHNTGLISVINCLSTYNSFKNYFLNEGDKINDLNDISFQFKNLLRSFNNPNENREIFVSALYKFRNLIINYGIRKNDNSSSEIDPISIISFLLNKLHGELNTIKVNLNDDNNYLKDYVNNDNKKDEAYLNYLIFYNTNFKSIISDNFFGLIKTKRLCNKCRDIKYSFNMQSFIPFNVSILIEYFNKKQPEGQNLDIYYCFNCLNKNFILLNKNNCVSCEKCEAYTEHNEFKQFYSLPKNLIIFFDRGDNYKYNNFINFEEKLVLNKNYLEKLSKKEYTYDLLGIICKFNETNTDDSRNKKFISFTKSKKGYIIYNDKKKASDYYDLNTIKDRNKFTVIGLFYYCSYANSFIFTETIKKYLAGINNNNKNNMINNNNFNENNFNNMLNMMKNNMNNMNFNNMNDNNLNYNMNMNNMNMNNMDNNNMNNMDNNNMNINKMNNINVKSNINFKSNINSNMNSNEYNNNIQQSMQYIRNNISASIFKNESNNEFRQNMNNFNNRINMMNNNNSNNQNYMNNFKNNNNGFNQNNMNNFNNNNGFNQNNGYNNNYNNGYNQNNMMNNNNSGYNQNGSYNNFDRFNQNNMNNNNSYQNMNMNYGNNNSQLNSNQSFN